MVFYDPVSLLFSKGQVAATPCLCPLQPHQPHVELSPSHAETYCNQALPHWGSQRSLVKSSGGHQNTPPACHSSLLRWAQWAKQIFIYGFASTVWTLPNAASDKGSTSPLLEKQLEMLLTYLYSFCEFPTALPELALRVLLLKADRKHPGSDRACSSSLGLTLAFGKENTQAGWQGFAWLSGQVLQTTAPLRSCSCAADKKRPAIPECMLTHAGGSRAGTRGCLRDIPKQPLSVLCSMSLPQSLQWLESCLEPAPAPSHPHHTNTTPGQHHTSSAASHPSECCPVSPALPLCSV